MQVKNFFFLILKFLNFNLDTVYDERSNKFGSAMPRNMMERPEVGSELN